MKTFDNKDNMTSYCKKPFFSRAGKNVTIVKNNNIVEETTGNCGTEGYVYQELFDFEKDCNIPIFGSWIIDSQPCGIGILESNSEITTEENCRFIPHIIE